MNIFTIVLIIIVCIILFTYFYNGIKQYKRYKKTSDVWPPLPRQLCPDYWIDSGKHTCTNPFNLGTGKASGGKINSTPITHINLNSDFHTCSTGNQFSKDCLAAKCSWAKSTNNPWFGVGPNCNKNAEHPDCYCPG